MLEMVKPNRKYTITCRVQYMTGSENEQVSENLRWIACGPNLPVNKYNECLINGFYFHYKQVECLRKIQSSGIVLQASSSRFVSARDRNLVNENLTHYGVVKDIIWLDY